LRALLAEHGIHPAKALGQNFVIDPNTIRKIVRLAGIESTDAVLEIGAGVGSLTLELVRHAASVTAIEVDGRLVEVLREVLGDVANVDVIEGDAMAIDLRRIPARRLVANLPYNIAASAVLRVLEEGPQIRDLTVMTQMEVGRRLASPPGSKTYGLTSALVAYWGKARVAAPVSRRAFYPEPNVDSVIVVIERGPELPRVDRTVLFSLMRSAFGQRRKALRNSLAELAGSADAAAEAVRAAGLPEMARPEQAGLDEFVAMAETIVGDASA
jgi:16S rRNA (adenine1518-N6/adenine1519-N6)-dimethyltransferase